MSEILKYHKRKGKKFIPPLLELNPHLESRWNYMIPEYLWISLIIRNYGLIECLRFLDKYAEVVKLTSEHYDPLFFITMSSFNLIKNEDKKVFKNEFKSSNLRKYIDYDVLNLSLIYLKFPLKFLFRKPKADELDLNWFERYSQCVSSLYNRYSVLSVYTHFAIFYFLLNSRKVLCNKEIKLPNFKEILNYPDTDESKHVSSFLIASFPTFYSPYRENNCKGKNFKWVESYWEQNFRKFKCELNNEE